MKNLGVLYLCGALLLVVLYISKAFCIELDFELNHHEIERQVYEKQEQYREYDRDFYSLFNDDRHKESSRDSSDDRRERDR